mmetsp:Transcript_2927/g.6660  ORF Transcript_2927/g.6660 Transcript_2927/m.6660 type:complete len:210 (+) Transcript_2927:1140-1769(+)
MVPVRLHTPVQGQRGAEERQHHRRRRRRHLRPQVGAGCRGRRLRRSLLHGPHVAARPRRREAHAARGRVSHVAEGLHIVALRLPHSGRESLGADGVWSVGPHNPLVRTPCGADPLSSGCGGHVQLIVPLTCRDRNEHHVALDEPESHLRVRVPVCAHRRQRALGGVVEHLWSDFRGFRTRRLRHKGRVHQGSEAERRCRVDVDRCSPGR